jgi:polyhydroxybutyrate depolymerase
MKLKQKLIFCAFLFLSACGSSPAPVEDTPAGLPPAPAAETPSAPSPSAPLQAGDYTQTLTVGADTRSYLLHVPANYDGSTPLPLVLIFHGGGGTAQAMVHSTQMSAKADLENFIVAYTQATIADNGISAWNTGLYPYPGITADDDAYTQDVIAQIESQLNVDTKRIYAAGFSNGSMMTYRLAAKFPDIFAAVAIAEGTIAIRQADMTWLSIPDPAGPIPVLIMHGYSDPTIHYNGGQGPLMYTKSVEDAVNFWTAANADHCTDTHNLPSWVFPPPFDNVQTADFTACANGSEVELIGIGTGVHQWPTLNDDAHFDGTSAAWEFFKRHSKTN